MNPHSNRFSQRNRKRSLLGFFNQRFFRSIVPVMLSGLCLFLVLSLHRSPAVAQGSAINQAKLAEILDSGQVFIQNKQAKVEDLAKLGQRIRTGDSRAQLLFNTGAVARLGKNAVLTVGDRCSKLKQGILLVNGAVNGCTASSVAGVRGTTYILEVDEKGQERIQVLEGEVTLNKLDPSIDPENPASQPKQWKIAQTNSLPNPLPGQNNPALPVGKPLPASNKPAVAIVIAAGQEVKIAGGQPGSVQQISQDDFTRILKGSLFDGFNLQLPGIDKIQSSFQGLFPGIPFPISIPGIPVPGIPGVPRSPF